MRVGWPIAFANLARRSCSGVISNFAILTYLLFAKLQTIFDIAKLFKLETPPKIYITKIATGHLKKHKKAAKIKA